MKSPNYLHYYYFLFLLKQVDGIFSPDSSDYNAYGVKITMNDYFLILAQNNKNPPSFFIQLGPFNQTQSSSTQCSVPYPQTNSFFVYTVHIGKQQNQSQLFFFFAGEQINGEQSTPFIGLATYTPSNTCNGSLTYSLRYLDNYKHQEYYIIAAHPTGQFVYGFSNEFIFIWNSANISNLNIWSGNVTWNDTSFIPHAVDVSDTFGVVTGFIKNSQNSTVKYNATIYLFQFNILNSQQGIIIVNQYTPEATPNTWQDLLTNSDVYYYSAKYDMSVSIDKNRQVLVGMQFINRVFLLSINISNPIHLNFVSRYTNGRTIGNGKSVAWSDNGIAAILVNLYTMNYIWTMSQVFIFDIYATGYISTTIPLSVFPNSRQTLPSSFSSVFLNVVSSPSSALALLDDKGNILIFTPTEPEYYPNVQDTGRMPFVTSAAPCKAGFFKNKSGVHDCVLCPSGTKNPGNSSRQCIPCEASSFCPLGSVADISYSLFPTISQAIPYPRSTSSVVFDEILLTTMFSIGEGACLVKSPMFWAVIVATIVILIIVAMEIIHVFGTNQRSKKVRKILQTIFRHTDLIGEGEYWISGLVSFCVIVIVGFACAFSVQYVKQYPIETSRPSYFACDPTIRNAKFETNVQSLAIPFAKEEQTMFDLLNAQRFTLTIDFINTMINCDAVWLEGLYGLTWTTLRWLDCNNINAILTLIVELPFQLISVRVYLEDSKTVGGIRMGLSGLSNYSGSYTLRELNFRQAYWKNEHVLSRTLPVALSLTKVINETEPMEGDQSDFTGIYIPTFTVDMNSLFVTIDQYIRSALVLTTLSIDITETSYYVKNSQEPIARHSEIIFRDVLFSLCCLELFGLAFLAYKLAFKPLYYKFVRSKLRQKYNDNHDSNHGERGNTAQNGDIQVYHL